MRGQWHDAMVALVQEYNLENYQPVLVLSGRQPELDFSGVGSLEEPKIADSEQLY